MKDFFKTLFNPGEGICTGDMFATEVLTYPKEGEFFCVNPLDTLKDHDYQKKPEYSEFVPRRADLNVSSFRNFIFEPDSLPLEDQLKIFQNCDIPFTTITYSGGKSYHAVLSVDPKAIAGEHTLEGVVFYKTVWSRLAAYIDLQAQRMGYSLPEGSSSFLDPSCKNPSRFTRYPEVYRSNGKLQALVQLTERMPQDEFLSLLSNCPVVKSVEARAEFNPPEYEVNTVEEFIQKCPAPLLRELKFVPWGGPDGNYRHIFRVTKWAIDSTNVSKAALVEFMEKYTFKSLLNRGYPANKLMLGVDHAYRDKGL